QGIPVLCDTAEVYIVVEDVYFDLSLDKHLSSGQASLVDLGADVRYTIVVRNEGLQSAYNIVISDYLPAGMELSPLDSLWQLSGVGEVSYTFSGPLLAGSSDSVEIIVRLSYGYSGESKQNVAEVLRVEDAEGEVYEDIDSEPDNGMPDEDDYDTAEVGLLSHDPTGYIYCDKTGKLVEGGTISVSGPGVVYMIADGSAGYYEWYTDGTPGLYTMSY